jgi:hypothetical protein
LELKPHGTNGKIASLWQRVTPFGGYIASAAAVGYGLPHIWWGFGVPWMFPGEFADRPSDLAVQLIAYWGFGGFSLLTALFGLALARHWGRGFPRWVLLIPAWAGAVVLTVWGLGFFYLQYFLVSGRVESAPAFTANDAHPAAVWGFYWYGVFVVWGISLGLAAVHYRSHSGPMMVNR